MKVKFAGKWYEVAMVQYNFGKPYYEIYDEPDTDPEHTDWITHPEEVIDDDGENSSFNTVSNIETKHQPTENSNDEILRIFNKRRPYCPSDFKKQHFINKLPKDI